MNFQRSIKKEPTGRLGAKYWQLFMKQNEHRLTTKRGQKFGSNHADWSKKSYIKSMYDSIYDVFIEAGVAKVRDK